MQYYMRLFIDIFVPRASDWFFKIPLYLLMGVMIAITIERFIYVFHKSSIDANKFMYQIRKAISGKDFKRAMAYCNYVRDKALAQIVLSGLAQITKKGVPDYRAVQNAMDEGTLEVIPRLQARINYLAMIGNIATLIGLTGTIFGLIISFDSVSGVGIDAAEKSALLASGIKAAMETTFFGLIVAVPALVFYQVLHNKTIKIIDEIDEHTVKLINLISQGE